MSKQTDNTIEKRKATKRQTMVENTTQIEQYELYLKPGMNLIACER